MDMYSVCRAVGLCLCIYEWFPAINEGLNQVKEFEATLAMKYGVLGHGHSHSVSSIVHDMYFAFGRPFCWLWVKEAMFSLQ